MEEGRGSGTARGEAALSTPRPPAVEGGEGTTEAGGGRPHSAGRHGPHLPVSCRVAARSPRPATPRRPQPPPIPQGRAPGRRDSGPRQPTAADARHVRAAASAKPAPGREQLAPKPGARGGRTPPPRPVIAPPLPGRAPPARSALQHEPLGPERGKRRCPQSVGRDEWGCARLRLPGGRGAPAWRWLVTQHGAAAAGPSGKGCGEWKRGRSGRRRLPGPCGTARPQQWHTHSPGISCVRKAVRCCCSGWTRGSSGRGPVLKSRSCCQRARGQTSLETVPDTGSGTVSWRG